MAVVLRKQYWNSAELGRLTCRFHYRFSLTVPVNPFLLIRKTFQVFFESHFLGYSFSSFIKEISAGTKAAQNTFIEHLCR